MEYNEYKLLVDNYKLQNPEKYELKKDLFEKKLQELKGGPIEDIFVEVAKPQKPRAKKGLK